MNKPIMLSLGLGLLLTLGTPSWLAASPAPVVKAKPSVTKPATRTVKSLQPASTRTPVAKAVSSTTTSKTTAKTTSKPVAKTAAKTAKPAVSQTSKAKPAPAKAKSSDVSNKSLAASKQTKAAKIPVAKTKATAKTVTKTPAAKASIAKTRTTKQVQATAKTQVAKTRVQRPVKVQPQTPLALRLESSAALVIEQNKLLGGQAIYEKNSRFVTPIASVTKLMTAMVTLDARLPMDEMLTITQDDVDMVKKSASRLKVGTSLTREEMLRLALMSSENRAAHALGRHYPGGLNAFVTAMNFKAAVLGMRNSRFYDPTGLSSANVATAEDLARMVSAAYRYHEIRHFSTTESKEVEILDHRILQFRNTNPLVKSPVWDIGLSKTGFIKEAGHCLVMQANIGGRDLIIVLLDSAGKYSRVGDSNRIKQWIERAG